MNPFVYHIASGQSFFTGIALVVVAAIASLRRNAVGRRISAIAFLFGTAAIVLSSTPIPYWFYVIAVAVTLAWLFSAWRGRWQRSTALTVVLTWLTAAAIESPYCFTPTLHPAPSPAITVIADSITAGLGDSDKNQRWPQILARQYGLEVQDLSRPGETTGSACKRAKAEGVRHSVVVLEIGGNDLLGSTSTAQFARDLDELLACVCKPQRQVVMFELPLPPLRHEYGRIQRDLAKRHGVLLIPKRVLLSILAPSDSTVDTIHLTQAGQNRMAAAVWQLLAAAFPEPREADTRADPK